LLAAPGVQAALTVRALDASAAAGGTDTVEVWLEGVPGSGVNVAGFTVKLEFDTGVLVQPTPQPTASPLPAAVTMGPDFPGGAGSALVAGEITVGFVAFPGPTLTADALLFSVTFTVQATPSPSSSALSITQSDLVNSSAQDLGATAGQDGTFTVTGSTPTVEFSLASSSGSEGTTPANLEVGLSASSGDTVTVQYAVTGGTATGGVDYTRPPGTLTFLPGQTAKNIPVTIVNDSTIEADETIKVTLSSPTNATLGGTVQHRYWILDNDLPTVEFDLTTSSGSESTTPASLAVRLSASSPKTVRVRYAVTGGTAIGGVDYTLPAGTLIFLPGQTAKNILATIVNDSTIEANETVKVSLFSPANATLGGNTLHRYWINDDDLPTVEFDLTTSSGSESTTPASLAVSLSAASPRRVKVRYAATGGTAVGGGVDYTLPAGTLTFLPGQTAKNVLITVVDDGQDESDETIKVTLFSPINCALGGNVQHRYWILDDDVLPGPEILAGSSSGEAGQQDVPVEICVSEAVTFSAFELTLSFGTDTLEQPAEGDVEVALEGVVEVDVSTPGEVVIAFASGSDVTVEAGSVLATVRFGVLEFPFEPAAELAVMDATMINEASDLVPVVIGPPGEFSVGQGIMPINPKVMVGEEIRFTTTLGEGAVWSLVRAESGGSIEADTGLYRAGDAGGVDEVRVVVDGEAASTEVAVGVGQE